MKRIMLPAMTLAVLVGFSDQSMDAGGGMGGCQGGCIVWGNGETVETPRVAIGAERNGGF